MALRHLPRYATDLRALGVTDDQPRDPFAPAFPHTAPVGESGGGAAGGGGSTTDSEEDGDDEGSKKSLADMSDSEKADYWKRQARANERKLKAAPKTDELEKLKQAAKELEQIRDGQRTESEKAVARAETAEKELADLKPKFERLEVAYEKGLPPKLAARLVGSTRAELEADADALIEEFGDAVKADAGKADAKEKEKRAAARKGQAADAGVRGTRDDTKPSVSAGRDLYAERKNKTKTAA